VNEPAQRAGDAAETPSLRAFARREPLLAGLFAAATIALLAPIWIGRYVPLLDYPNHLSIVFVWRHLSDPAWGFAPWYQTHLVPLPYWGLYGPVYVLSLLFNEETAQKLALSGALLALPVGVALYARRMGRDPRLAIFAFPLAWNFNVENGFLSYVSAIALLFFALAALDSWADSPSARRGALACSLGVALYFLHILPWLMFLFVGGIAALLAPRPWSLRRALLALSPTVPAFIVGVWAYRASSTMAVRVSPWSPHGLAGVDAIWWDLAGLLRAFPEWLMDLSPDSLDEACLFVLAGAWLLLVTTRPLAPTAPDEDRGPRAWRLEAALGAATVLLFLLPRTLRQPFYWFAVNSRVAVVVALLAALAVRGALDRSTVRVRRLLLHAAALAAVAYPLVVAAHFHRFNRRARGFDEVMADVPRGTRVLPLMLNLGDPDVNVNCFNQWGSYVQMRLGGYVPYNNDIGFPLRVLRHAPAPPWDHPEYFHFAAHGAAWDAFLVHGPSRVDPFAGAHDRVRLVKQSGDWALWEKLPATPPANPQPPPTTAAPPTGEKGR
jgi:hypothetical protein